MDKYVNSDDFKEKVEDHVKGARASNLDPYNTEIDEMLEKEMRSNLFHKQRLTEVIDQTPRHHDIFLLDEPQKEISNSYYRVSILIKALCNRLIDDYYLSDLIIQHHIWP